MHYMLDLETLSTRPDSAIIQIGMAAFNETEVVKSHLWRVYPEGNIDADTVMWWFKQISDGVPNPMPSEAKVVSLEHALQDLGSRLKEIDTVWSHRSVFDFPILEWAHTFKGMRLPWSYKQVRDTITFAMGYEDTVPRVKAETLHDAESDAIAQAKWMIEIFKAKAA